MERAASVSTTGADTPSSRKDWCNMLFDSFTGSRLAYLETPEGGTRSSSHWAAGSPTHGQRVAVDAPAAPRRAQAERPRRSVPAVDVIGRRADSRGGTGAI